MHAQQCRGQSLPRGKGDEYKHDVSFVWFGGGNHHPCSWDCKTVREVWFNLGVARNDMEFFNGELKIWMTKNVKATLSLHWDTIFLFAIWI